MRILALDQASITTGWAFFDKQDLIQFGHWEMKDSDVNKRINKLAITVQ